MPAVWLLVRGCHVNFYYPCKYLISRAGESEDTSLAIADGAVFQRDGLIVDVGPTNPSALAMKQTTIWVDLNTW